MEQGMSGTKSHIVHRYGAKWLISAAKYVASRRFCIHPLGMAEKTHLWKIVKMPRWMDRVQN